MNRPEARRLTSPTHTTIIGCNFGTVVRSGGIMPCAMPEVTRSGLTAWGACTIPRRAQRPSDTGENGMDKASVVGSLLMTGAVLLVCYQATAGDFMSL